MPKVRGVYRDAKGGWYFKAATHKDPVTGKWKQVTRRGFATAAEATRARQAVLDDIALEPSPAVSSLTVSELIDQYLDDREAGGQLSVKSLFDYRHYHDQYIRPWIGSMPVRDVDAEVIVAWQRHLSQAGAVKTGKGLAPNTIRLARAPLNGAFKQAVAMGMLATNPVAAAARPKPRRSIPKHWSPEQAREFLALHEGDRLWPVWAFLLGSGVRIGELVFLRWPSVDLDQGLVRINEFATVLGYDVHRSDGKSTDAVRTIDIDPHLREVLRQQRRLQAEEQLAAAGYEDTDLVFTKPAGGAYHPQFLSRLLGKISAEVGLPRLTAHGLRHTSATLMLARGVSPKVAAERLGHADATLFTNLYSHVTPTMQKEAAAQIGDALFGEN
ncbi:MAG: site-specific integrase [Actinomycetia bacterium]|nr:site-specific integrase [Actinomycetes bacterium]